MFNRGLVPATLLFLSLLALSRAGFADGAPGVSHDTLEQQSASPVPLLRSTTRNVLLDIVVTDQAGHPVRDLKAEDFVVVEDKQPQIFHVIDFPQDSASEGTPSTAAPPGPKLADRAAALTHGRARNILLLDEMNVRFFDLAFGRKRLEIFLRSEAAQGQEFALMAMTTTRIILVHDFTSDTAAIAASLQKLPAATPATGSNDYVDDLREMEDLRRSAGVLETIASAMSGSPDHVNLFWITSGFPQLAYITSSPELQFSFDELIKHTSNLYLDARLTLYTIDPHGVQSDSSLPSHNATLDQGAVTRQQLFAMNTGGQFADQTDKMTDNQAVANSLLGQMDARTGGRAYSNQNFIDVPLTQAVRDGNSIYTVAYSPLNKNFHGEYRQIAVTLRRPGLHARTRDGYYAIAEGAQLTEEQRRRQLEIALDSPLPYGGLEVTGELGHAHQRPVLQVKVEARNVEWNYDSTGAHVAQTIAVAGYTSHNKAVFSRQWKVTIARPNTAVGHDLIYTLPFQPPPAAARLRIAVADTNGNRIGTNDIERSAAEPLEKETTPELPPLLPRAARPAH